MRMFIIVITTSWVAIRAKALENLHDPEYGDAPSAPWATWTENGYLMDESKEQTRYRMSSHQKSGSERDFEPEERDWVGNICTKVRAGQACDGIFRRYHEQYVMDGDIMLAGLFPIHLGTGCLVLEEMGSIQRMEAMAYAVKKVNSWPGFIKVKLMYKLNEFFHANLGNSGSQLI